MGDATGGCGDCWGTGRNPLDPSLPCGTCQPTKPPEARCQHCGSPMDVYQHGCPERDDPGGPCVAAVTCEMCETPDKHCSGCPCECHAAFPATPPVAVGECQAYGCLRDAGHDGGCRSWVAPTKAPTSEGLEARAWERVRRERVSPETCIEYMASFAQAELARVRERVVSGFHPGGMTEMQIRKLAENENQFGAQEAVRILRLLDEKP